jgi:hypothetical protein
LAGLAKLLPSRTDNAIMMRTGRPAVAAGQFRVKGIKRS